jgi:anaerobic magnesium-protoporphyrin IX monomethyl ester cyclase
MKIALIDVNATRALGGGFSAQGSRLISALLKRAGHSVKLVFLARQDHFAYTQDEIEQLHEILKHVDLAMVAVYSACAHLAVQVTDFIHRKYPGMKVIWGGPHCIAAPELSLRYADGVCFSEGDECVVDFVNKLETGNEEYLKTANMAFNINGSPVINDALPPFEDLDSLPFSDYSLDDKFVLDGGLFPLTKEKAENYYTTYRFLKRGLFVLTSRGCPHQCSYCNNCRYIALFGLNHVRFHSVARFMDELEAYLNYFGFFSGVGFADDDFFLRPAEQLAEFAERYKRTVGLPFGVTVSANTYRREKMEILLDAGMKGIEMGVQSASQRVLDDVFNRKISVAKTRDVVRQIEPYCQTHRLTFLLDFITDNPYETKGDIIQTYRYLVDLPPRVVVNLFNLVFFPGTPIYDRAVKDGIIAPHDMMMFRSLDDSYKGHVLYQNNYETFLVYLAAHLRQRIPRLILRVLGSLPLRGIASIFPKSVFSCLFLKVLKIYWTTNKKPKPSSKAFDKNISPDSLYFSRGLILGMRGMKAEAMSDFRKCVTLSDNPELIKMAKRLAEEYAVK